jgi:hypothetical protein
MLTLHFLVIILLFARMKVICSKFMLHSFVKYTLTCWDHCDHSSHVDRLQSQLFHHSGNWSYVCGKSGA